MSLNNERWGLVVPLGFLIFALTAGLANAQWLHVRVEDQEKEKETVRLNLPLGLVEAVIPVLQKQKIPKNGVQIGGEEITVQEMREIWNSIKSQGDYELVTVQQDKVRVRVLIEGDYLYVISDEDSSTTVNVRVPVAVVDALLSGEGQELNIASALRALSTVEEGDLVSVRDKATMVRVWIDQQSDSM